MNFKKTNFLQLINIDIEHFSSGELPKGPDIELKIQQSLFVDSDANMALALSQTHSAHPILLARAYIAKGSLGEAKAIIEALQSKLKNSLDKAEAGMDLARVYALQGRWADCASLCSEYIELNPVGITLLSLLNLRALAKFELMDFQGCERDLRNLEPLLSLFPHSVAALYSKTLQIKIFAIMGQFERAEVMLRILWVTLASRKNASREDILALLRSEISINGFQGKSITELALACYLLSRAIGNDLYVGLSLLDLYFSIEDKFRKDLLWSNYLMSQLDRHERVKLLYTKVAIADQIDCPTSLQLKSVQKFAIQNKSSDSHCAPDSSLIELLENSFSLVLLQKKVAIHLSPWSIQSLSPQILRACEHLRNGAVSREAFFNGIWNRPFVSHLHDAPLDMLLRRLRKAGLQIHCEDKTVWLSNTLIIGTLENPKI